MIVFLKELKSNITNTRISKRDDLMGVFKNSRCILDTL